MRLLLLCDEGGVVLAAVRLFILTEHRQAHRETRYRATAEPSDLGIAISGKRPAPGQRRNPGP